MLVPTPQNFPIDIDKLLASFKDSSEIAENTAKLIVESCLLANEAYEQGRQNALKAM